MQRSASHEEALSASSLAGAGAAGVDDGFALLAALLSDGVLETISLVLLAAVVGEVLVSLLWRKR